MQTLRQTLEHVDDHEWLEKRSPLAREAKQVNIEKCAFNLLSSHL